MAKRIPRTPKEKTDQVESSPRSTSRRSTGRSSCQSDKESGQGRAASTRKTKRQETPEGEKKGSVKKAGDKSGQRAESSVKTTKGRGKSGENESSKTLSRGKRDSRRTKAEIPLSDAEKRRRELFAASKSRHVPTEAELIYGVDRLPVWEPGWLLIQGARQNNLKSIDVPIPLSAFTAVTGVSGSGKSSLINEILCKELSRVLNRSKARPGAFDRLYGVDRLNKVIEVDQQPLGQTPTSNPATYTGLFEMIRNLFAQLPEAKMRGYTPRRFSFNVPGGRCEKCEGAGQLKIEMHFLADVWITCDACAGKRYDQQTLEVKYKGKSIADVLEMSCGEALSFFSAIPSIRRVLKILCDVGLDYIALGQSATTLSGGEAQRVKLAAELSRPDTGRTLYLLDEPTTGLHFDDLRKLLDVLHRLVDLGNTVVVIEHNLDIIKSVDWVVDLGPEAGLDGGQLVFAGTPEELADYGRNWLASSPKKREKLLRSWTAEALIPVLDGDPYEERKLFDAAAYQEEMEKTRFPSNPDEEFTLDVPMPWETDGRTWHTVDRRGRNGATCKWEGKILEEIVDRIADSELFADPDWNNRTIVEVRARKKSLGWFFHAITGEEWLLKLKFRVPKKTFDKDALARELYLKPLNEMDDIPLYGTHPRTKIETTGPWREIEMRVYRFDEIDRPEFWDFLEGAMESFSRFTSPEGKGPNLTPWKTEGEKWHFTPDHCYGGRTKPIWPISLLEKIVRLIRNAGPGAREVWTNKITVPFYRPDDPTRLWTQLFTKNYDGVILQINVAKNSVPLGRVVNIGSKPEVDGTNPDFDAVYLRFTSEKELDETTLAELLAESLRSPTP